MKNSYCRGCGAQLASGVKICPRCGKIVQAASKQNINMPDRQNTRQYSDGQRRAAWYTAQSRENGRIPQSKNVRTVKVQPKSRASEYHKSKPMSGAVSAYSVPSRKKRITKTIFTALKVVVLMAIIYFLLFLIQVTRVKMSSYDFDSEMKMSYSNYGQAIGNYFDEGNWSYNPFTFKCTYTGTSRHDEEYEIVFTVKLKVKVSEMTVDGDEYTGSAIESRLMAMFI